MDTTALSMAGSTCTIGVKAGRLFFLLILLLGAAFRVYDLAGNPPGLYADELHPYISVRSIVTTGHDVNGTLQVFLDCMNHRNPPIYGIAEYVSSLVFGHGAFGLRFPAAVFGTISIALLYLIALELTKRRDIALLAALFQATQPLFIHFSRVGWEPDSELPFLLGGLYAMLVALRPAPSDQPLRFGRFMLAALLLAATAYTYLGAWFYAALLGGALLAVNAVRFSAPQERAKVVGAVTLWAVVAAPALWLIFTDPYTGGRMYGWFIFKDGVSFASLHTFLANYAAHFSWPYLVAKGDGPDTRMQREIAFGAFYWWMLPLCVAGIMYAGRYLRERWMLAWVWVWLLSYPMGGALTHESDFPNAARTLAGAPVFCILAAIGLIVLLDLSKLFISRKTAGCYTWTLRGLFALSAIVSIVWFGVFYFITYPVLTTPAWEPGMRKAFEVARANAPGYTRICVGGPWTPTYIRYYIDDLPLIKIDNVYDPACAQPGTLLVDFRNTYIRPGFRLIAYIPGRDGAIYDIVEGRPALPVAPIPAAHR